MQSLKHVDQYTVNFVYISMKTDVLRFRGYVYAYVFNFCEKDLFRDSEH